MLGKKIQAKQESGLTAVRLKRDPPVIQSPTTPCQLEPFPPQLNLVVQSPTTPGQFDPFPQLNLVVQSPITPGQFDPPPPPSIKPSGIESTTPGQFDPPPPPSIKPSGIESTTPGQFDPLPLPQLNLVVQSPTTPGQFDPSPSCNHTQWYRALLHQVSLPCGRMQMYPVQMYPLLRLNLMVQSPTTPCQFDMWKNADVPCAPTNQT